MCRSGLLVISCMMLLSLRVLAVDGQIMRFYPLGDQFLIVGSELRVNCTLKKNRTEFDIDQVYIQKGGENISQAYLNTYKAESTFEMVISNVSIDDSGFYQCFYGQDFQSLTKVTVAEIPVVSNISCVTYEMQNMCCSFILSKPSTISIRWQMEYRQFKDPEWHVIPQDNCNQSAQLCWWDDMNMPPSQMTFMAFAANMSSLRIAVASQFETQYSEVYTVNLSQIAKFGPVVNLSVFMGNRHAQIRWKRPTSSDISFEYKIIVTSEDNWQANITKYVRNSYSMEVNITIEDLIPYSNYSVTVWNKVMDAIGDVYWSSASRLERKATLPDVPTNSVTMTTGSYVLLDYGKYMNAVLYWKNPDERDWYGQIIGYEVQNQVQINSSLIVPPSSGKFPRYLISSAQSEISRIHVKEGLQECLQFNTSLLKSHGYTFTVFLLNMEGRSKNMSQIMVPDWNTGQQMQPSWVSVELLSSGQRISWEIDDQVCGQITNVTVYWCQDQPVSSTYIQCKENFNWHTFEVGDGCKENVKEITTNSLRNEDYKYGVSIATAEFSGGIHWENFRFKNLKDVPKRPLFSTSAEQTSIRISVLYEEYYVSDGGRPDHYYISYKKAEDGNMDCQHDGTRKEIPVDFNQPDYVINNLDSGTQYKVCVWSGNAAGHSEIGEPLLVETSEESSMQTIILLGTLIPLPVILCIILGCVLFMRWRRRLIEENQKITLPHIDIPTMVSGTDGDKNEQPICEQDSGKGDSSISSHVQFTDGVCDGDVAVMVDSPVNWFGESCVDQMSPMLSGSGKFDAGVDLDDSKESDSLVDWEDSKNDGFVSSSNYTESVRSNKDKDKDSSTNKSSPNTSEYVDHDFPHLKSSVWIPKLNSIAPAEQINQTMPQNSLEYLPHSFVKMAAVQSAKHSAINPSVFSNFDETCVEKFADPLADNKLSYENPVVFTKPEHFYFDTDEDEPEADDVNKKDNEERNQIELHQTGSTSIPLLDSYTVAYSGSVNECNGANLVDSRENYSLAVVEGAGESQTVGEEIDNRISFSDDNAPDGFDFGLHDYVHSDEISLSKYSSGSSNVSSVDIFGHCSGMNSVYAYPDVLSLGGGSTISNVSEADSVASDNFVVNRSPCRELSPELQSEKSAILHDIQTLVEPDFVNENSQIPETTLGLNVDSSKELDYVPIQNLRSNEELNTSKNTGETRMNSSGSLDQSYSMVGFTSSNNSVEESLPNLDSNKVIKVKVDIDYDYTHL